MGNKTDRFFFIKNSKKNRKYLKENEFTKIESSIFDITDKDILVIDSAYKSFWVTCANIGLKDAKNIIKAAHKQEVKQLNTIEDV